MLNILFNLHSFAETPGVRRGYTRHRRDRTGISIGGGLVFSQALTLFTMPATYVALDKLRRRSQRAALAALKPAVA